MALGASKQATAQVALQTAASVSVSLHHKRQRQGDDDDLGEAVERPVKRAR
jgi:hypothetical protein